MFIDARNYQILFLSLFLFLGIATRDWTLHPQLILVTIVTCLITQWLMVSIAPKFTSKFTVNILNFLTEKNTVPQENNLIVNSNLFNSEKLLSLRSAAITSLGLCLLLRADNYTTMIIASCLAILSKFLLQIRGKHFFNPANFGIIFVLIFTPDAWVSPGQWGDDWWYGLVFLGTGGIILKKIGRLDTTAAFLGVYILLETIRNIWLGWTWDVLLHKLMSGSLLLFALFMITDPRSIPNAKISRLIWAISLAGLTFILRNYFFLSTAMFWALFTLSPLTIGLDIIWSDSQFSWLNSQNNKNNLTNISV